MLACPLAQCQVTCWSCSRTRSWGATSAAIWVAAPLALCAKPSCTQNHDICVCMCVYFSMAVAMVAHGHNLLMENSRMGAHTCCGWPRPCLVRRWVHLIDDLGWTLGEIWVDFVRLLVSLRCGHPTDPLPPDCPIDPGPSAHGRIWPAMTSHGRPWLAIAGRDQQ